MEDFMLINRDGAVNNIYLVALSKRSLIDFPKP